MVPSSKKRLRAAASRSAENKTRARFEEKTLNIWFILFGLRIIIDNESTLSGRLLGSSEGMCRAMPVFSSTGLRQTMRDRPYPEGRIGDIMRQIGLALSGGGFRATLYHLGVVRFLRDAGLLGHVSHMPTK